MLKLIKEIHAVIADLKAFTEAGDMIKGSSAPSLSVAPPRASRRMQGFVNLDLVSGIAFVQRKLQLAHAQRRARLEAESFTEDWRDFF